MLPLFDCFFPLKNLLSVSELIKKENCIELTESLELFFLREMVKEIVSIKLYIKQNLFFIPRLETILAKFDEVQNSGGMILSVCKGKNN